MAASATATASAAKPATSAPPATEILGVPMQFEKNSGQTDNQVSFLSRGPGYTLFLTPTEAVFSLRSSHAPARDHQKSPADHPLTEAHLRMSLPGANAHPQIEGLDQLPGTANYFIGNDPAKWQAGLATFSKVKYHQVYPGIDLIYYGNQRQLEYDFLVEPRANPEQLALSFEGAEKIELTTDGDVIAHLAGGDVRWHKPFAYQTVAGVRHQVAASFVLRNPTTVAFKLGTYDHSQQLVIDPAIVYATYLGGNGDESSFATYAPNGMGIAIDSAGNVFVVGQTSSRNFPTRNALRSTPYNTNTNFCDVFVTKLNATGTALIYSTYLGGISNDVPGGIAVDSSGNAYIVGSTESIDFPTQNAAFSSPSGYNDIFLTKLSSNGTSIAYSTYLGGASDDFGRAIAVDSSGNAYITGKTYSSGTGRGSFPTTRGVFQGSDGNGNKSTVGDAFVAKFDTSGAAVYISYLGGTGDDSGNAIAVDSQGNAIVAGDVDASAITTWPNVASPTFPLQNAYQPSFNNAGTNNLAYHDGFVTKVNPTGSGLVFSTFLGGSDDDSATGITVDSKDRIYVTGTTASGDFPSTTNAFQPQNGGMLYSPDFPGEDFFITEFETNGTSILYSTYLGGSDAENGGFFLSRSDIAVDKFGLIYVVGQTLSFDFPLTVGADQTNSLAARDVFVCKINPAVPGSSALVYSTLLSGSLSRSGVITGDADNQAESIALDNSGNFYVCGITTATNFPATAGAFQTNSQGGFSDAFVAKFSSLPDLSVSMVPSVEPIVVGSNCTYTIYVNNNGRTLFSGVTNFVQFPSNTIIRSISSSSGNWSTNNAGLITFNIGTMTNNASVVAAVVIGTSVPLVMTNTATLTAIDSEINTGNNLDTVISTVQGIADVSLTVSAPTTSAIGSNFNYSVQVFNKSGPWPATSLSLVDVLPAGLTFVSGTASQGICYTDSFGTVFCDFGTLNSGSNLTATITVLALTNGVMTNVMQVGAFELDFNPANNTRTVLTTIALLADLGISQFGPAAGYVGNNATYTLTVTNGGPYPASNLVITDALPAGAIFVSANNPQGTFVQNNGVVTFSIANLTNGAAATMSATAQLTVVGNNTNSVGVTSDASDYAPANNSYSITTVVAPVADLGVSQSASPASPQVGGNITFTLTATNRGPSTAANVVISDTLPSSFGIVSLQPGAGMNCVQSNNTVTCTLASLSNGGSAVLGITAQANVDGTFTNTARISSDTADLVTNNTSSLTVVVAPNPTAPVLKIARSGNANVILYWATNAAGFSLQSRPDLTTNSTWTTVPTAPVLVGNQYFVTNTVTGSQAWFRLAKVGPLLSAFQNGPNLVVSWSAASGVGGTLMSTPSLSSPSWATTEASKVLVGNTYFVTNPIRSSTVAFFELFY